MLEHDFPPEILSDPRAAEVMEFHLLSQSLASSHIISCTNALFSCVDGSHIYPDENRESFLVLSSQQYVRYG